MVKSFALSFPIPSICSFCSISITSRLQGENDVTQVPTGKHYPIKDQSGRYLINIPKLVGICVYG